MDKKEFYDTVVNMYRACGQGVPEQLVRELGIGKIVDELISEGSLKVVPHHFVPSHKFICLTKGYCTEEQTDPYALTYTRIYRGVDEDDCVSNKEIMKGYEVWLKENKDKLDEV